MDALRYPVGKFNHTGPISKEQRQLWIEEIAALPARLFIAVDGLSDEQLDTPYRPDAWTVRQVVHHVPDSHLNSYVRFKWTLTEEKPTIKPYDEKGWAMLPDSREPIALSLSLVEALHRRWVKLLLEMQDADFERTFHHPDDGVVALGEALGIYAWHGRHHVAHITSLRNRMGWA